MAIKIKGWSISNFRNIYFADLDVGEENIIKVSGKNGSGKSSIIEAIFVGLLGSKFVGKNPHKVIKLGEDKAIIKVRLDDEQENREIEVKRIINKNGARLTFKTSDGSKITQAYLDSIINMSMIDPLKWANAKPIDQINDLKEKAGIDTSDLEKEYEDVYQERRFVNREVKRLEGAYNSMPEIKDIDAEISLKEAYEAKNAAIKRNAEKENKNRAYEQAQNRINRIDYEQKQIEEEIARLKEKLAKLNEEKEEIKNEWENFTKEEIENLSIYDERIKKAQEAEENKKKKQEKERIKEELINAKKEATKLDEKLKSIKKEIINRIKSAELPFDNIRFDKELGVVVNDLPISEYSTAEQIKMAIKINAKYAPNLKVIYIKDGSLLDKETLEELEKFAEAKKFLFLVELVEEQDDTIVMREGQMVI